MRKKLETTYNYSISKFKVKIKSLAEEAKIIRIEEKKNSGWVTGGLRQHRIGIVRYEQRHTILAYCLMRGIPYKSVENNCKTPPDVRKIYRINSSLGSDFKTEQDIENWIKAE